MHYAATNGRIGALEVLLGQQGIDLQAKDRQGRTPLDDARRENKPKIARLIEAAIAAKVSRRPRPAAVDWWTHIRGLTFAHLSTWNRDFPTWHCSLCSSPLTVWLVLHIPTYFTSYFQLTAYVCYL